MPLYYSSAIMSYPLGIAALSLALLHQPELPFPQQRPQTAVDSGFFFFFRNDLTLRLRAVAIK